MSDSSNTEIADADGLLGKSWNERLEGITADLAGLIPEAGEFIKLLITMFWPGDAKPNVWDEVKGDVEKMLDAGLLQSALDTAGTAVPQIQSAMQQYSDTATGPTPSASAGGYLTTYVTESTNLRIALKTLNEDYPKPDQRAQSLPLWIAAASLNLAALVERDKNGPKVYGDGVHEASWHTDLVDAYWIFVQKFEELIPLWINWQVSLATFKVTPGFGLDTPDTLAYSNPVTKNAWSLKGNGRVATLEKVVRQRWEGEVTARLASMLAPVYTMHKYVEELSDAPPVLPFQVATFSMGPYCATTLGYPGTYSDDTDLTLHDELGVVTSVDVRSGDLIDQLQLQYEGHSGHRVGNASGGTPASVSFQPDVPAQGEPQRLTGFYLEFNNSGLFRIDVHRSAETPKEVKSFPAGGSSDRGVAVNTVAGDDFGVVGASFTPHVDPQSGQPNGVKVLGLQVAHKSLVANQYPGAVWKPMPNSASGDISVGGPGEHPWVLDSSGGIYAWNATTWVHVPGTAERIAIAADGTPWVIGTDGNVQSRSSADPAAATPWFVAPGWSGAAIALAAGGDGTIWALEKGGAVQRFADGVWTKIKGPGKVATEISVGTDGVAWVCCEDNTIFRSTSANGTGTWAEMPGAAKAIAVAKGSWPAPVVWCVSEGGNIYHWMAGGWRQTAGVAKRIAATSSGRPFVIQSEESGAMIFERVVI